MRKSARQAAIKFEQQIDKRTLAVSNAEFSCPKSATSDKQMKQDTAPLFRQFAPKREDFQLRGRIATGPACDSRVLFDRDDISHRFDELSRDSNHH
jgi:hypothetical protein